MGNILGQPFSPWVTKQIELRQESLGYVNYNNDDLLNQNAKTPWIRLASTVDIVASENEDGILEKLRNFGIDDNNIIGRKAAQNFILQGGAVALEELGFKSYTGLNDGSFYSGAYGWGGIEERGFVPLPGILDASLIYYNNGALAKAVVNMKCFSRNQLALMDALYMRPGYNLLLEFGWSTWLDNESGDIIKMDAFQSPPLQFLFNGEEGCDNDNPSHFEIPRLVNNFKEECSGNYEGVFGKVTNFKWDFNPDGSYNCQTTITGMGGIIESLKINGAAPASTSDLVVQRDGEDVEEGEEGYKKGVIDATKLYTKLDRKLDTMYATASKIFIKKGGGKYSLTDSTQRMMYNYTPYANFPDPYDDFKPKNLFVKGILMVDEIKTASFDGTLGIVSPSNPAMFLSLGNLFAMLQSEFLIYDENGKPMFTFDMDFFNLSPNRVYDEETQKTVKNEKYKDDPTRRYGDTNFIQNMPGQFSANPLVCLTAYDHGDYRDSTRGMSDMNSYSLQKLVNRATRIDFKVKGNKFLGRLAYVFVNYEYIRKCLRSANRNKDGSLAMLPFLQTMLDGICVALGGINKIEVFEDTGNNKIKFIENIPQNWTTEMPPGSEDDKFCLLNTFGVKNRIRGSIVKNIKLNASISKEFSSMISIGSQTNGNQLNENAVAFSNYNKGLIDRTFKQKLTTNPTNTAAGTSNQVKTEKELKEESEKEMQLLIDDNMNTYSPRYQKRTGLVFLIYQQSKWIDENIQSLVTNNKTYTKLLQGIWSQRGNLQSNFFLPFKLSLDIEGISGIKLFQKFQVDDNVLPPSYSPDSVDIQVKAANHTVNAKTWITKIETQSVPRTKPAYLEKDFVPLVLKPKEVVTPFGIPIDFAAIAKLEENPELFTITSKIPINPIFVAESTPKTQIYLHHTEYIQSIQACIDVWNSRVDQVSTHYITNNNGEVEQLYEDEFWGNHLGVKSPAFKSKGLPYKALNKSSIGIELSAWGGLIQRGDPFDDTNPVPYTYEAVSSAGKVLRVIPGENTATPKDRNGNSITWRGYEYFEKYSSAQIANVKGLITKLMEKYSIPFVYDYDELFPNLGEGISKKALQGEKGVYTHSSVRERKSDVFPQIELINMLKSIATSINEPLKDNIIVWEILFTETSTYFNSGDGYNYYIAEVKIKGTLNGESIEIGNKIEYSNNSGNAFYGGISSEEEALNSVLLITKEDIVLEGVDEDNNDWENAENTVPV